MGPAENTMVLGKVRKILAPPWVQIFLWLLLQEKINSKERVNRLGIVEANDIKCVFCGTDDETIDHLFITCQVS